jgi:hypothetical protein
LAADGAGGMRVISAEAGSITAYCLLLTAYFETPGYLSSNVRQTPDPLAPRFYLLAPLFSSFLNDSGYKPWREPLAKIELIGCGRLALTLRRFSSRAGK